MKSRPRPNKPSKVKSRTVTDNARMITFAVVYSRRKTVGIQVRPDSSVIVRAPFGLSSSRIDQIVLSRANWIDQHQRRFAAKAAERPLERQYISGEKLYYLGQPYSLCIVDAAQERVLLDGSALIVRRPCESAEDAERIKRLLMRWYKRQAESIFAQRLEAWLPLAFSLGIPPPDKLTIREMKTRWGSCSSKRRITLNLRLIELAPDLIDYVIAHELCHLRVMNHGEGFYALLSQLMPDWKEKRKHLHGIAVD